MHLVSVTCDMRALLTLLDSLPVVLEDRLDERLAVWGSASLGRLFSPEDQVGHVSRRLIPRQCPRLLLVLAWSWIIS